jgi:dephospho-CoA kinase
MKYNQNEKLSQTKDRDTQRDDFKVNKSIENRLRYLEQKIDKAEINLNNSGNISARLGSSTRNVDKKLE